MRQVGDTLVWLVLIAVVAAVLYLTPVVARFVSSGDRETFHGGVAWRVAAEPADGTGE